MKILFITLALILTYNTKADDEMVISVKQLTLETALTAAKATIDACRKKGVQIGVTVVDRAGQRQVTLRDVLAPELTDRVSYKKAYTAASFTTNTSELRSQAQSSLAHVDKLFFGLGGVVIQAGGMTLGAIGVSGSTGAIDEECAQAGLAAIQDDLEMTM